MHRYFSHLSSFIVYFIVWGYRREQVKAISSELRIHLNLKAADLRVSVVRTTVFSGPEPLALNWEAQAL